MKLPPPIALCLFLWTLLLTVYADPTDTTANVGKQYANLPSDPTDTTTNVGKQYANLPYPPRNPADEAVRLLSDVHPAYLDFYIFQRRVMTMPLDTSPPPSTSTRVLIAGGGTGDVVVYLAEMCSRFIEGNYKYRCGGSAGVEFYHLDLSNASIDIAKERLGMRGLLPGVEGVTVNFLQGSLLGLEFEEGRLALGLEKDIKFDYINSVGVLHHLASPTQGLRSLNSVLKPDGGMFIMLYGAHGRTGVYDVQSAIKDMGVDTVANPKICLDIVKSLISSLPPTHRLYKTVELMSQGDNLWPEESEIYDIFCHSQDRAYTVEQVFEFISEGGQGELTMASWHQPVLYRPSTYIKPAEETKLLTQLFMGVEDEVRLFALAEKLGGSVHGKHQFFLEKKKEEGGAIYKGRDWEVTGFGTREFQDTVLCSSMEEDIKDFTKDMWGEKFSEAYKADKGLNCVMQFEGATAGHGIEVKKNFPCSVMRVLSLIDCRRSVVQIWEEVVRLEGFGDSSWWRGNGGEEGLEVIWVIAKKLFEVGYVVPLLDGGVGGGGGGEL